MKFGKVSGCVEGVLFSIFNRFFVFNAKPGYTKNYWTGPIDISYQSPSNRDSNKI